MRPDLKVIPASAVEAECRAAGISPPETVAQRVRRLQAEARDLAKDHVGALVAAISDAHAWPWRSPRAGIPTHQASATWPALCRGRRGPDADPRRDLREAAMNAAAAKKVWIDPVKEAKAVAALRVALANAGVGDDEELLADSVEGQTDFLEVLDIVLGRMTDAEIMIEGISAIEKRLAERRRRHERRVEADRTVLEQALTIAELPSVVRPSATLTVSCQGAQPHRHRGERDTRRLLEGGRAHARQEAAHRGPKGPREGAGRPSRRPRERAAALAALPPEIPGACLSNGAPSLTIRRA